MATYSDSRSFADMQKKIIQDEINKARPALSSTNVILQGAIPIPTYPIAELSF